MGQTTISWSAPTENSDGSPLTDLAGFKIYYGTSPSALADNILVSDPLATNVVIKDLSAGTWYFVLSNVNTLGIESEPTDILSKEVSEPMSNTINAKANNHIHQVARIHGAVSDFIIFLQGIQSNIGIEYSQVIHIPARVTTLINQKEKFDALGISDSVVKKIFETNHGYDPWTQAHTADLNAIVNNAIPLRTAVENNISSIPLSYNASHHMEYITASAVIQTALNTLINDILISVQQ